MGERSHVRSLPPQTPAATHIEAASEPVSHRRIKRRGPLFVAGALPVAALLVAGPPGSPQQIAAAQTVMDLGTENPADLPDTTNPDQGQPGGDVIDPGAADSYTAPDWNFDQNPAGDDQGPAGDDQAPAGADQQAPAGDIDEELPAPDADAAPDATAPDGTTPAADSAPGVDVTPAGDTAPAPAGPAPKVLVARNSPFGERAMPGPGLAPIDASKLHLPNLAALPPVAPIAAPDGMLRIGSAQVGYRGWLPDEAAGAINDSAAQGEAQFARTLDAAGFDPTRSDLIAADTIGGAVQGAAALNAVVSPLTATGAATGAATGFVCGIPFLPIGLVIGPMLGGAIGTAIFAGPATVGGAALGSLVGAAAGLAAPAVDAPADVMPSADDAPAT